MDIMVRFNEYYFTDTQMYYSLLGVYIVQTCETIKWRIMNNIRILNESVRFVNNIAS